MRIKFLCLILISICLVSVRCGMYPPPSPISKLGPTIRIGIAERLESLALESNDAIDIWDQNDQLIAQNVYGKKWQVKLVDTEPVTLLYRLFYREVNNPETAQQLVETLADRGIPATIKQVKKKIFRGRIYGPVISYQVFLKPIFESEEDATEYQRSISEKISTTPLPFYQTRPGGKIILINQESNQQFESPGLIRVQGHQFAFRVRVGEGFHFENEEVRRYKDQLEFWIDRYGKLTVVNVLPIEEYLKGVVGSEMHPKFPLEALKSQAVAARSYTLARLDKQHRLEPFDVCDEVHCHVYGGIDHEAPEVNEAVSATLGKVVMSNDRICDTFYASVCGGHSENNENVWNSDPQPYLRGGLDSRLARQFPDDYLTDESNIRKWIESSPDVYCNPALQEFPEALNYTKKYFRWKIQYTKDELTRIIFNKTNEKIGSLIEIIPVKRGVSGRLMKIKLRGTSKTISIDGELAIRKALSTNYLYSSCFVVDREGSDFIIKGAGWGHGVGMCQTGAAIMALRGSAYEQILNHYYPNSEIIKLY